jgi:hypothetical protein
MCSSSSSSSTVTVITNSGLTLVVELREVAEYGDDYFSPTQWMKFVFDGKTIVECCVCTNKPVITPDYTTIVLGLLQIDGHIFLYLSNGHLKLNNVTIPFRSFRLLTRDAVLSTDACPCLRMYTSYSKNDYFGGGMRAKDFELDLNTELSKHTEPNTLPEGAAAARPRSSIPVPVPVPVPRLPGPYSPPTSGSPAYSPTSSPVSYSPQYAPTSPQYTPPRYRTESSSESSVTTRGV